MKLMTSAARNNLNLNYSESSKGDNMHSSEVCCQIVTQQQQQQFFSEAHYKTFSLTITLTSLFQHS